MTKNIDTPVTFSELVRHLDKERLQRLAQSITRNEQEAQDVVQDTLLKVWEQRNELSEIRSLEAYATTICRHLAIDRTRRAATNNIPLTPEVTAKGEQQPDEALIHAERLALARQAIAELPDTQRHIIHLREAQGKTYQDIATLLGISEAQVKVYLHRARQKIKRQIEDTESYGL